MRRKHASKSTSVRLWAPALSVVEGWVQLTGWSASKVASLLVVEASLCKGTATMQRLKAEAEARNIIKRAEAQAAAVRRGKGKGAA